MKMLVLASAAVLAIGLGIARAADGNGCPKQLAGSEVQSEQAQGGTEVPSRQAVPTGSPQARQQFAATPERIPNTASGSQLAVIDPNCRTSQNK